MIEILRQHTFGILLITFTNIYIWSKLLNKKPNLKDIKTYVIYVSMAVITLVNYLYTNQFIRILFITILMSIFIKFLFKEKFNKAILSSIMSQLIYMISEAIYAILISIILGPNLNKVLEFSLGTLITNISISIIAIFIVNIKIIRIIYEKILNFINRISYKYFILLSFFLMAVANVLAMTIYFKIDFTVLLIFNVSMTLICCFIIIYSFRAENNYNIVSDKYNIAINSLKDYEDMMTKYRISNHENKNLLLTVRAMIINKEKNIPKYIDSIVEEKYNDDEKLLFKMNKIPTGGLRATIYSEILKIQENNINYSLEIDRNIKTIDLIELDTSEVIDICKVVSVFIDNAIEAVKNLKTKNINISLYLSDDKLNIEISNNYSGEIDVEKIFLEGYTTKGAGHGYGLSLVKAIINRNNLFENNIKINKNIFSQILTIKIKS